MSNKSSLTSLYTDLYGKVVLVTGASSSGIGRETAIEFAKNGCIVAITGRNEDGLKQTKAECLQASPETADENILIVVADLSKASDCEKVVNETIEKFGKLDILVNNAGVWLVGTIETTSIKDFEDHLNINLRSVFIITKTAVPYLKKTKGNIVTVSSVSASFTDELAYCTAKAGIDQFTKNNALDLAQYGIRVNSVNPGLIETDIFRGVGIYGDALEKYLDYYSKLHPIGRNGKPEEIAKSIIFLSSNTLSGFTTGINMQVDGGLSISCCYDPASNPSLIAK